MKMECLGFPFIFLLFFLSHTLLQRSEKEKISSAKQKKSLVLAKTLWVTAAGGATPSGCARGAEHREGFSSCVHVCCTPGFLWAYYHVLYNPQLSFKRCCPLSQKTKDIHFSCDQKHKNIIQNGS